MVEQAVRILVENPASPFVASENAKAALGDGA